MAKAETVHVDIAAIARPGDTVLIGFMHNLSDEEIEALNESFQPLIEQGLKVGFMDQVTSMVVFRPEEGGELTPYLGEHGHPNGEAPSTVTLEGYAAEGER